MHSIEITIALLTGFVIGVVLGSLDDGIFIEGVDIKLERLHDESGEFKFEFTSKDGDVFSGETWHLIGNKHLMIIDNNIIYGFEIDDEQQNLNSSLYACARPAEQVTENEVVYTDDFAHHHVEIDRTRMKVYYYWTPYYTLWNKENVCFTKTSTEDETFSYELKARNNRRKLIGKTRFEDENPLVQYIDVSDQCKFTLIINITTGETNSNETFCKETIFKASSCVLGDTQPIEISSKLLNSLLG